MTVLMLIEDILKPELRALSCPNHRPYPPGAIRLDLNESPFPPSPKVIRAVVEACYEANRYPIEAELELESKIAEYVGLESSNIVIGNGSDCLIHAVMDATIRPGDTILMPFPSFQVFAIAVTRNGGNVKYVRLKPDKFKLPPDVVIDEARNCKAIVIVNPNNPTGNMVMSPNEVEEILSSFNGLVIVDEAYYEYSRVTVVNLVSDFDNLVVLRTFSKAFCMAGLRVGYAVTSKVMARVLRKVRHEFPVSTVSLRAAIAALDDLEYMRRIVSYIERERKKLYNELKAISGVTPFPSCTNFILFKASRRDLARLLAKRNIFIRDFSKCMDGNYFRVSIGRSDENRIFLKTLREILES